MLSPCVVLSTQMIRLIRWISLFVPNVHEIFVQLQIARGMTSGHLHLPGFHGRLLFLPFSLSSSSCFTSPNVYARSVGQDMRLSIARFMIL